MSRQQRFGVVCGLLVALASPAFAARMLRVVEWEAIPVGCDSADVSLLLPSSTGLDGAALRVANNTGAPQTITVATIDAPQVARRVYAVRGQVRYTDVRERAYLEMWNVFPTLGRYFTRTLSDRGLMKYLEGSSDWRPFVLPFRIVQGSEFPTQLIVNVVLPSTGTVHIGPLEVVEFGVLDDPLVEPGAWWGNRMGGMIGGIVGGTFGLLGALIGILCSRGRGRRVALALTTCMIAAGVCCLVLGGVAVLLSQPHVVYYPLLLIGVLVTVIPLCNRRNMRQRFQEAELRRMQALDAGVDASSADS